jgi:hypothetical protein
VDGPAGQPADNQPNQLNTDIAVKVNFNAEGNLIAVYPIIECISSDLFPEYCHDLESSAVYTVPPSFV